EQHGSICPLENMNSHRVLCSSSNIFNTGQDLTFLNTYKNV
ncbi:hypothetical protein N336_03929, partial [Phalacrocorax carbo]